MLCRNEYAKECKTQPTVLNPTKCHEYKQMRKDEFHKNVFGKEYFYKATQFWPTDVIFKSLDIFVLEFNIGRSMTKMRRNPNEPSHQLFLLVLVC